jgi:hypothetical protein
MAGLVLQLLSQLHEGPISANVLPSSPNRYPSCTRVIGPSCNREERAAFVWRRPNRQLQLQPMSLIPPLRLAVFLPEWRACAGFNTHCLASGGRW